MLLHIIPYIMLAYLMLLAALSNVLSKEHIGLVVRMSVSGYRG